MQMGFSSSLPFFSTGLLVGCGDFVFYMDFSFYFTYDGWGVLNDFYIKSACSVLFWFKIYYYNYY